MSGSWVLAPAKVNLRLEVLGKRPDGFHELRTWMLAVDLCDRLRANEERVPGVRVEPSGPMASADVPRDERNLAVRAIMAGLEAARAQGLDTPAGVLLELEKHIPSEAGLGGASADAAAALWALEELIGRDLGSRARCEILARLGSDCVFFERARQSGFALCTGRGELVQELPPVPDSWRVLVVTPEMRSPTSAVFAEWGRTGEERGGNEERWTGSGLSPFGAGSTTSTEGRLLVDLRDWIGNDLQAAAEQAVPDLRTWLEALSPPQDSSRPQDSEGPSGSEGPVDPEGGVRASAPVFTLSGSGSSVFSLFESEAQARLARTALERIRTPLRGSWILKPAGPGRLRIPGQREV